MCIFRGYYCRVSWVAEAVVDKAFCLWGWGVPSTGTGCYLLAVHSCRGGDGPGKSELTRSVAAKRERDGEGRKEGGGERWKMRRPLDSSAELGLGRAKKVCEGGVHRKSANPSWAAK
jgi:hypothetical protein